MAEQPEVDSETLLQRSVWILSVPEADVSSASVPGTSHTEEADLAGLLELVRVVGCQCATAATPMATAQLSPRLAECIKTMRAVLIDVFEGNEDGGRGFLDASAGTGVWAALRSIPAPGSFLKCCEKIAALRLALVCCLLLDWSKEAMAMLKERVVTMLGHSMSESELQELKRDLRRCAFKFNLSLAQFGLPLTESREDVGISGMGHSCAVWSLLVMRGLLFSASADGSIGVWPSGGIAGPRWCAGSMVGHNGSVTSLAAAHSLSLLCSGGVDRRVMLWGVCPGPDFDFDGRGPALVLTGHAAMVTAVAVVDPMVTAMADHQSHSQTLTVASASFYGELRLWKVQAQYNHGSNAYAYTCSASVSVAPCLGRSIAAARQLVLCGSFAAPAALSVVDVSSVSEWSTESTTVHVRMPNFEYALGGGNWGSWSIASAVVGPDPERIGSGHRMRLYVACGYKIAAFAFSPDDIDATLVPLHVLEAPGGGSIYSWVTALAVDPGPGGRLFVGLFDATVRVVDLSTWSGAGAWRCLQTICPRRATPHPVQSLAFDSATGQLYAGHFDGTIRVWE